LRAREAKLLNKKVIITAGGTKESIDPVRYITNRSSGKMGFALAQAAVESGAKVTLISTQKAPQIYGVDVVYVNSAAEMYQQVQSSFVTADIFISAAAVSDYRPANEASQKIKKEGSEGLNLSLVQNVDILSEIGHSKSSNQFVVGFAAETNNLMAYAQKKLKTKQADMLIANDVSRSDVGFNSDDNAVTILVPDQKPETTMLLPKIEIARLIMNRIGQTFA
ncbi:MAG: bifunctional phosphopantothenoylcysteine decarboxylase/phosphopantothenate--cysteine ligase CoaBC, partial [Leuconostoc falkenbergense]